MPLTLNYLRLVIGGAVSDEDTWTTSYGVTVLPTADPGTASEMNDIAEDVYGLFLSELWEVSGSGWQGICNAATNVAYCYAYHYNEGELVAQGSYQATTPSAGTGGAIPAFIALCVTELTDRAGRSGRGRSYLPATGVGIHSGTLQAANLETVAPNLPGLYGALNKQYVLGGTSETGIVSVMSPTLNQGNPITALRLDSLLDTQRGRSNKATADYVYSAGI